MFQGVWFVTVLGAADGHGWAGPLACGLFLAATLAGSRRLAPELRLIGGALALGLLGDSALALGGVLRYASPLEPAWLAPPWIVVLWPAFALLIPRALSWLRGRYALAALLGAAAGPLTYLSAGRLGAAELSVSAPLAGLACGLEWGLAMPALVWLAGKATGRSALNASRG